MQALPTGIVSFCFTDIEGSTRLFSRLGERYEALLAEHRRMIREAIAEYGGAEIKTEGDGSFLAFQHAASAVKAAGDIQRALGAHAWPADAAIRVRIGVHTGEARPSGRDYVALAVHQAARVADAGHGGQVIVSQDTASRMHVRVADAIEGHHAGKLDQRAADVAHHLFSAGAAADPERTVRSLALAGRRALDAVAFEEALVHFERALSIAPDAPTAARAEILQGHGRCCLSLGRWDEALAELQKALDIYETIGDADAVGKLAANLAYLFTFASRYMEGMQVLRVGLAALGERRTPERGRLLSQLGMMTSAAGYREIGDPMLAEAQALAHDLANPALLAQVAQSMTFRHYSVSEWGETVKYGLEAKRLSHQTGDHYNTMNSTLLTVSSFAAMARFDEAETMLGSAAETAKRVGNFGAWLGLQSVHVSMAAAQGEPPEVFARLASDLLEHHRDRPQLPSVAFGPIWMALAMYWLGRWDDAVKHWTEGARLSAYGGPD